MSMDNDEYERCVRAIDWHGSPGAYAADFPLVEWMIRIVSEDEKTAAEALQNVIGHVCHQDILEDLAPDVAGCLIKLLGAGGHVDPALILSGLLEMARAAWIYPVPFGFHPATHDFSSRPLDHGREVAQAAHYDALSERLVGAYRSGLSLIAGQLTSERPEVRAAAGRLLAFAAGDDVGDVAFGWLQRAWEAESDVVVKGQHSIAIAIASLKHGGGDSVPAIPEIPEILAHAREGLGSPHELERASSVCVLLLIEPDVALSKSRREIGEALRERRSDDGRFVWGDGYPAGLVAEALTAAPAPDDLVVEVLLDGLLDWLSRPRPTDEIVLDRWTPDILATRLVERGFREHLGRRDYLTSKELSPLQKLIVAKLGTFPATALANYPFAWCGIRRLFADHQRLLGLTRGGLDVGMKGIWEDRPVNWPLWKWWHQARLVDVASSRGPEFPLTARDYVLQRMRRQLPPKAIWNAARDAVEGAYDMPHAPLVRLAAGFAGKLASEIQEYADSFGDNPSGPQAALLALSILSLMRDGSDEERGRFRTGWRILPHLLERIVPADLQTEAVAAAKDLD
jgi:hypothetical protein